MNLGQLRKGVSSAARRLSVRVPTPFVADYQINEAGDEILRDTKIARVWRTFKAVAGTPEYQLTGIVLGAYDAEYNGIPLDRTSPEDLREDYGPNWRTRTGPPTHWFMDSIDVFRPWPIPSTDLDDGLSVYVAVGWEQELVNKEDDPAVLNAFPAKYHRALIYRVSSELWNDRKAGKEYAGLVMQMKSDVSSGFSDAAAYVPYRHI